MTDRIALVLAILIVGIVAADLFLLQTGATLFLARKFLVLVDWAMFWR